MSTKITIEMVDGTVLVIDNVYNYIDDGRLFKVITDNGKEKMFMPVRQIKIIKIEETE